MFSLDDVKAVRRLQFQPHGQVGQDDVCLIGNGHDCRTGLAPEGFV